jgi:IMP dehydrogenase/GMP reductase
MNQPNVWDNIFIPQSAFGLDSRNEAYPYYIGFKSKDLNLPFMPEHDALPMEHLPVMVAPMDSVLDGQNFRKFEQEKLVTIIPRNTKIEGEISDNTFVSMGMKEFEEYLKNKTVDKNGKHFKNILIDVANGNMPRLHRLIESGRDANLTIMAGNVGSFEAFIELEKTGVDFIRVGIGTGSACNTTVHTGVGQNLPNVLAQCKAYKTSRSKNVKIIADGGFKKYSDIIKALYYGADYVMSGSIFAKCREAAGETFFEDGVEKRKYRGMSTKDVQELWKEGKNETLRHSEGKTYVTNVEYSINEWVNGSEKYPDELPGFTNVLKSAMSYVGKNNLYGFAANAHKFDSDFFIKRHF